MKGQVPPEQPTWVRVLRRAATIAALAAALYAMVANGKLANGFSAGLCLCLLVALIYLVLNAVADICVAVFFELAGYVGRALGYLAGSIQAVSRKD